MKRKCQDTTCPCDVKARADEPEPETHVPLKVAVDAAQETTQSGFYIAAIKYMDQIMMWDGMTWTHIASRRYNYDETIPSAIYIDPTNTKLITLRYSRRRFRIGILEINTLKDIHCIEDEPAYHTSLHEPEPNFTIAFNCAGNRLPPHGIRYSI